MKSKRMLIMSLWLFNIMILCNLKYVHCLAEDIVLPESIEYYGKGIFDYTHIRKITFPSNMKKIPALICASCHYLDTIVWPENVQEIGTSAFADCSMINKFTIQDSVTKVNEYAFENCENLEEITVGKSVTEIPQNFISNCNALKTIINNSKTSIPLDMLMVRRSWYADGKKGYDKDTDAYFYRYSENEDMSDPDIVVCTAPYGSGLSKKLKKGKTYYVEITRYLDTYMDDSEDYEEPIGGWHCKRKVVIR